MVGVDTRFVLAQMVYRYFLWYGAVNSLVNKAMGQRIMARTITAIARKEFAISLFIPTCCPNPTRQTLEKRTILVNLGPEALLCGKMGLHRKFTPSGAMQREVNALPLHLLYHASAGVS